MLTDVPSFQIVTKSTPVAFKSVHCKNPQLMKHRLLTAIPLPRPSLVGKLFDTYVLALAGDKGKSLQASVLQYSVVERGIEGEVNFSVTDSNEVLVWEGTLTVLSRNLRAVKSGATKNKERRNDTDKNEDVLGESVVSVGGDMGLQYAKVTGDWNPHHLYPWTAKLLGYRSPIAHGMWTMARSLHEVLHSDKIPRRYPIHVDCAFKRPLFMPGEARIQFGVTKSVEKEETFWFKCTELKSGAPHVVGTVRV